jgi:hypothetical protein
VSRLRLIFELTVIVVLGILLVTFFVWCAISLWRDLKNRGVRITNDELVREHSTIFIPLSDLQ